jgi:hypothetical protein
MRRIESFWNEDSYYYAVWIEPDGREWSAYEVWECCEHAGDSKEVEEYSANLLKNIELDVPSPYDCSKPVEYAARGRALCGRHFEEIKFCSKIRWARFGENKEKTYRYE